MSVRFLRLRRGFTLTELLVVIAIVGLLLSLLLPAVQKIRTAAARTGCANNLRQLALGTLNYHETNQSLPVGHRSDHPGQRRPMTAWTLDLLPYLEQDNVYRDSEAAFGQDRSPFDDPPHVHFRTVIRAFVCPADSKANSTQVGRRTGRVAAFTSYLGVSGLNLSTKDGVFLHDRAVRIEEITDGTSNTLSFGERPPSYDFQLGWWYAGIGQGLTGSADQILGVEELNLSPLPRECALIHGVYLPPAR